MNNIDNMLRTERAERSPCKVMVTLLSDGVFCARMSFGTGMESASAYGTTSEAALQALNETLAP